MGFPSALAPTFLEWEMGLLHTNDLGVIAQSTRKVVDYLRGEIADRQAAPRDDLLSYGVTTQIAGRTLTDAELDRKSTRLNSSHLYQYRIPSSAFTKIHHI